MKKLLLISLLFIANELFAQNTEPPKTTQKILMSYKWSPIDIYEEEDNETCFVTYTKTQEIDSATIDGELEVYIVPYYLSDTQDLVFDKNKVGKATTGKYMIQNVSADPKTISTFTFEIIELSGKKMVLKNLTPWVDAYTKTTTYLSSPKNPSKI